jgi:hypothetical protein
MHMTAQYIYQKFSKGDGICRCNKAMETSGHVLHECQCDANSLGREQMTHKVHGSIRDLVAAGAVSPDWGWFLSQIFTLDKNGSTSMWAKNTAPDWVGPSGHRANQSPGKQKKDILRWVRMGSECLWKGSSRSASHLRYMGMPAKTAEKWSGNLRDLLLDGATAIWRLRCRELRAFKTRN